MTTMQGFGEAYKSENQATVDAGAKRDLELTRKQLELVAEQLRDEGREVAALIVEDGERWIARQQRDLEELREEIAELKGGAKSSRGKDRAKASGTINASGKARHGVDPAISRGIAPPHKHEYDAGGACIKVTQGIKCTAQRQRQRKPKQTVIPGVDGVKASSTSEAGS